MPTRYITVTERMEELRAAVRGVSPGSWCLSADGKAVTSTITGEVADCEWPGDREFILAAREHVPVLLRELDLMRQVMRDEWGAEQADMIMAGLRG